jgi:hypothetical protein
VLTGVGITRILFTAVTVRIIVQNVASTIQLKMAAGQQFLLEFFSGSLDPRFRSRKGEAEAFSQFFLGETLVFGEN